MINYNLTSNLNNDIETEPDYNMDTKFKLKLKFNINKRKHLQYNDILEIEKEEKKEVKNNYKEIVFKKLEDNNNDNKIINKIFNLKINNNIYLHTTKECSIYNEETQYIFDYIKCNNKDCNVYYCNYCFNETMNTTLNKFKFILFNDKNKYIFKYPYNNIYKCFDCNYNIPIISSIHKCSYCSIYIIKKTTEINKNKCYYCNNYLCDICKKKNSTGSLYDNIWCSKC